ncbi:MAG TPA: alpha/beta fold hydrolase [Pyrinomonadaceae bacterium]|jgi:hypothetical protein
MSTECEPLNNIHLQDHDAAHSRAALAAVARALREKPFRPHPLLNDGHSQTLGAYFWPRRFRLRGHGNDERRLFEVEPAVRLLAHCRWQEDRLAHPTVLLVHGLEGSSESVYMVSTAIKAFRAGFNVVRLNQRNCGGSEGLTQTLYHSGLVGDLRAVLGELTEGDHLARLYLVGFSMSGNMALKLAGEDAGRTPPELRAVCAVSPSVDLRSTADAIERRSNWLYRRSFIKALHRRVRTKKRLYPDVYDTAPLGRVRTIRDFDELYTARHGGYAGADDYYDRASSRPLLKDIRLPTLIIHAQDDPFIPFEPLRDPSVTGNPNILLLAPEHGGHVGFVGARADGEDRFWAENRVVEFCRLVEECASDTK